MSGSHTQCILRPHCSAVSHAWSLQVPNPEDKTAMAAGVDAVLRSQSDLGVVLDTDVDRSAVVSSDGQAIAQNRYIALMSVITLRSAASG